MVSRGLEINLLTTNVLLELLLTDVQGLLGSLALGEGVTVWFVSAIDDVIRQRQGRQAVHRDHSRVQSTGTADRSTVDYAVIEGEGKLRTQQQHRQREGRQCRPRRIEAQRQRRTGSSETGWPGQQVG